MKWIPYKQSAIFFFLKCNFKITLSGVFSPHVELSSAGVCTCRLLMAMIPYGEWKAHGKSLLCFTNSLSFPKHGTICCDFWWKNIYIYSFLLSAFAQLVCVRPFCHPNFADALHFHTLKLSMKMSSCHWSMRKVTMCCPPTRMFWWPCVVSWMKNICGEYELGVMMLVSGLTSLHICSQIMHSSIFWVLSWAGQVYKCRGVLLENGFSRKCRCC